MRYKCDNQISKKGKEFTCGRFLADIDDLTVELKCPSCKKVHRIPIRRPIEAQELITLLQDSLLIPKEN